MQTLNSFISLYFLRLKKKSLKFLVGLSIATLLGILYFGLKLNGFQFSNGVNWITDQPGIRFSKYSIAHTKPFIEFSGEGISVPYGFSLEIALKPARYQEKGFNIILGIHSGKEINNLLLVQVASRIYLVSGDDYDLKRKTKRIRVNLESPSSANVFITMTTGKKGSAIYLNGQLIGTKKDLTLKIPDGSRARLLLGNSVYGKHSWQGDVYGLAFYGYTLTAQDIKHHFNRWIQDQNFSFFKKDKLMALYLFDEKRGTRVIDQGGGNHHIEIPVRMEILKKKFLSQSWSAFKLKRIFISDRIINLFGFIPFGFIIAVTLIKLGGPFEKNFLLVTITFCFIISLIIEIFQAWIPSRSSHMQDLILNTFGALTGAMIIRIYHRVDR